MSVRIERQMMLSSKQKDIIVQGDWLNDMHMDHFNQLLKNCSDYRPEGTWKIQLPQYIESVAENKKHIQILFSSNNHWILFSSNNHWVCGYYDKKNIFIYDSFNIKKLHKDHEQFLIHLFPFYSFDKQPVKFPTVQNQPNCNDCGVFAIAFAISLLFNIKPEKVRYDHNLMRSHLIKIFESNVIEHFPQDLNYNVPQKVFSLALIKRREAEATRLRVIRQKETEQEKANRLQKNCEFKKELRKKNKNIHKNEEQSLEENSAKKRCLRKNNSEEYRAERRRQYENDLENNRAKKRKRYEIDSVHYVEYLDIQLHLKIIL
ncbi:uncharacterized protein [Linepithema humile]|uniref:uncharacterized protein n=1 Tax=Linepithema humile TaxID=83485 RepID=UPI00351E8F26